MHVVALCVGLPTRLQARVLDVEGRDDACAVTLVKAVEYVRFSVKPCWHIPASSGGVVNGQASITIVAGLIGQGVYAAREMRNEKLRCHGTLYE